MPNGMGGMSNVMPGMGEPMDGMPGAMMAIPRKNPPGVLRVYPLKDVLGNLGADDDSVFDLAIQILKKQVEHELPYENVQFYPVPHKEAVIVSAQQPVHDSVARILAELKTVCETLNHFEVGNATSTPVMPRDSYDSYVPSRQPTHVSNEIQTPIQAEPLQILYDPAMTVEAVSPPSTVTLPVDPVWEKIAETERKLASHITDAEEMRIGSFISAVKSEIDVVIQIDNIHSISLEDASDDMVISTADYTDFPVSTILNRYLKKLELIYTFNEDGDAVITTPEAADAMLLMKTYAVGKYGGNLEDPAQRIATLLTNMIGSDYSSINGFNDNLIVDAPYHVHKKIQRFLDTLPVVTP